jgi:hypothetical protein
MRAPLQWGKGSTFLFPNNVVNIFRFFSNKKQNEAKKRVVSRLTTAFLFRIST